MEKIYKPNVGWLFWAHLMLIFVILAILAILTFMGKSPSGVLIPILLILLIVVMVTLLVVARTMYTLDDEKVLVQGAFKKREIPYETVTKIVNTNKGLVGEGMFVLSADRIAIFFGEEGKTSISPREKEDALETLRACCPNAEYQEDFKPVKEKEETDQPEEAVPAEEPVQAETAEQTEELFREEVFPEETTETDEGPRWSGYRNL